MGQKREKKLAAALALIADYYVGYTRDELEQRITIARCVLGDERQRVWLPDPGPERDADLARSHPLSWADSAESQAASDRITQELTGGSVRS